jgi:cytochrome c biogenesis protein CcmG, thiol:disulfide interchange protein DsbE
MKFNLGFFLLLFAFPLFLLSQENSSNSTIKTSLPSINIKTLDGKSFNTASIDNDGKPVIISFWASWCKACIKELTAINEQYDDWQKETGVKLIAVSIDDARTKPNVLPLINGKGWEYEFLSDENSEFKRAMNISSLPHMFILNNKKEVVWQHNSYTEGDEMEVIKVLKGL